MTQLPHQTQQLEELLSIRPGEVIIGKVVDLDKETGIPWVDYPGNPTQQFISALTTISLSSANIGREVALLFAEGDITKPVIMGLIRTDLEMTPLSQNSSSVEAQIDNEKIVLSAEKEIVLKCGEATITLTRAGKILIRGAYILSRSSGANKIKGGHIELN